MNAAMIKLAGLYEKTSAKDNRYFLPKGSLSYWSSRKGHQHRNTREPLVVRSVPSVRDWYDLNPWMNTSLRGSGLARNAQAGSHPRRCSVPYGVGQSANE